MPFRGETWFLAHSGVRKICRCYVAARTICFAILFQSHPFNIMNDSSDAFATPQQDEESVLTTIRPTTNSFSLPTRVPNSTPRASTSTMWFLRVRYQYPWRMADDNLLGDWEFHYEGWESTNDYFRKHVTHNNMFPKERKDCLDAEK